MALGALPTLGELSRGGAFSSPAMTAAEALSSALDLRLYLGRFLGVFLLGFLLLGLGLGPRSPRRLATFVLQFSHAGARAARSLMALYLRRVRFRGEFLRR